MSRQTLLKCGMENAKKRSISGIFPWKGYCRRTRRGRGWKLDRKTLDAYESDAAAFAEDWHTQPAPVDLQALVRQFFRPGPTADIGCGGGRDTAWLNDAGFPAIGFDASEALLAEAHRRHPSLRFRQAALPELEGIEKRSFTNVLCETVIMHMAPEMIGPSVRSLLSILEPGGTLYLSWRVTEGMDRRDDQGRLYAAFDPSLVTQALSGTEILLDHELVSASSGKIVHRIVARIPR